MEGIELLRSVVTDLQDRMKPLNNKLENPRITLGSRLSIESSLREIKIMWFDAMCDLHAHHDYVGALSYQKENNPFR